MATRKVGRYLVKTTNEKTILFPKAKITKGDLIDYYENIAPIMLPYMKDRPISMQRFPEGINSEGFYQKDAPDYFPVWIKRMPLEKQDGKIVNYVVVNNAATLVYLANQACITMHTWLSRTDKIDIPDRMIFDLDPAGKKFSEVQEAALIIREMLALLDLPSFVMTTGSRGLHVLVPIKRKHSFDWVRSFALDIATLLARAYPDRFTIEVRKAKRHGRIFLDILRNAFGQTAVTPYAVRPKPSAPIATPITWKEAGDKTLTPTKYTIKNIFKRLSKIDDPWQHINDFSSSLDAAAKKLARMR